VGDSLEAHVLRVQGLHLILLERLHFDDSFGGYTCMMITMNLLCHYSFVYGGNVKYEYNTYHGVHNDQRRVKT
jgi:hypothetical protein